jgi:hypothetical protein
MKLTGKLEDAKKIAMDIVARSRQQQQQQQQDNSSSGGWSGQFPGGFSGFVKSQASNPTEELIVATLMALHQGRLGEFTPNDAAAATQDLLVDLSLPSSTGHTLLHLAVLKGYHHLAEVLLALGRVHRESYELDVNAVDSNGFTPLHYAVITKSADAVQLLRSYGADPTINDEQGRMPEELIPTDASAQLRSLFSGHKTEQRVTVTTTAPAEKVEAKLEAPIVIVPLAVAAPITAPAPAPAPSSDAPPKRSQPRIIEEEAITEVESDEEIDLGPGPASGKEFGGSNDDVELFIMDEKSLKQHTSRTALGMMLSWMVSTSQRIWAEYKFALYISALIVCFSTMLIETLPYNFSVGAMREGSGLTSTNPSIISNKDNPKPFEPTKESTGAVWTLYFVLRLGLICSVLMGLAIHYRPAADANASRASRVGFWASVFAITLIFIVGLAHILGFISLF